MQNTQGNELFSPVELLVHLTIDAQIEKEVIESQREFQYAAAEFAGHLNSDTKKLPVTDPGKVSFVSAHTFDSADHLIRWLESEQRNSLMEKFEKLFKGRYQVYYPHARDELSAWLGQPQTDARFRATIRPPSRWKTNLVVLTALYPMTLLLPPLLLRVGPDMSRPTSTLITAFFAVSALGFFLVPLLSRGLAAWLRSSRLASDLIGAIGMALTIAIIWQIACFIDG